jgi:hypothetical protein
MRTTQGRPTPPPVLNAERLHAFLLRNALRSIAEGAERATALYARELAHNARLRQAAEASR